MSSSCFGIVIDGSNANANPESIAINSDERRNAAKRWTAERAGSKAAGTDSHLGLGPQGDGNDLLVLLDQLNERVNELNGSR